MKLQVVQSEKENSYTQCSTVLGKQMQKHTAISESYDYEARPFLRWAGGKQKIVPKLIELCDPLPILWTV